MLTCANNLTECDSRTLNASNATSEDKYCGTPFAYLYFISFFSICSFLVRLHSFLYSFTISSLHTFLCYVRSHDTGKLILHN